MPLLTSNCSRVSIAMATCNGAAYLDEQLASFAAQSRAPDELVVTDDLSDDATLEILGRFADSAPFPVRIHRNPERLGLHRNFERAMALASGDLILISDQDDVWYPNKIKAILAAMAAHPDSMILYHDEHILDQASGRTLEGTVFDRARLMGCFGDHGFSVGKCTTVRSQILPVLLPFPAGFGYDAWINWLPDLLQSRLVVDLPLQLWRRHGTNASWPTIAEEKPSRWKGYWKYGRDDPRPGWAEYRGQIAKVRDRIAERADQIDRLLGNGRAAAAVQRASSRIEALDRRISLLGAPRRRRFGPVLGHWARGFYKEFSGWRSAVKDLWTPR